MAPGTDLTGEMNEEDRHRDKKNWDLVVWGLGRRNSNLACLLYGVEQGGELLYTARSGRTVGDTDVKGDRIYGISWTKKTGLANLCRNSLCRGAVFRS